MQYFSATSTSFHSAISDERIGSKRQTDVSLCCRRREGCYVRVTLDQDVNMKAHISASSLSSTSNPISLSAGNAKVSNPYSVGVRLLRARVFVCAERSFVIYMCTGKRCTLISNCRFCRVPAF